MNINKNNLFARYYRWIYGNLPIDLCSFFWGSVLAIGLFPILIVGRLSYRSYNYSFEKGIGFGLFFWGVYAFITLSGLLMYADYMLDLGDRGFSFSKHYHLLNLSWYGLLFGMPLVTVWVASTCALVVGVPCCIVYLILKLFKVVGSTSPATVVIQNTRDVVGAIRGKYCTKINWK
jgi:hypothetical protein